MLRGDNAECFQAFPTTPHQNLCKELVNTIVKGLYLGRHGRGHVEQISHTLDDSASGNISVLNALYYSSANLIHNAAKGEDRLLAAMCNSHEAYSAVDGKCADLRKYIFGCSDKPSAHLFSKMG